MKNIKVLVLNPSNKNNKNNKLIEMLKNQKGFSTHIVDKLDIFYNKMKNRPDIVFMPADPRAMHNIPSGIDYPDTTVNIYGKARPGIIHKARKHNPNVCRFKG